MGSLVLFVDSAAFNTEDHEMLPGVGQGCDECPKPCPVCSQGAREASQSGCGGASRGEGEFPCLSAERVGTVRELADTIEEYLEGTKERERRRVEADHSADAGDELAERYHEFVATRPETLELMANMRAQVEPWAPIEDKHELWDFEDMMRLTDALRVRTLQSAVSAYEHALDRVHNHARARQGLARLYWSELQRARRHPNWRAMPARFFTLSSAPNSSPTASPRNSAGSWTLIGPAARTCSRNCAIPPRLTKPMSPQRVAPRGKRLSSQHGGSVDPAVGGRHTFSTSRARRAAGRDSRTFSRAAST